MLSFDWYCHSIELSHSIRPSLNVQDRNIKICLLWTNCQNFAIVINLTQRDDRKVDFFAIINDINNLPVKNFTIWTYIKNRHFHKENNLERNVLAFFRITLKALFFIQRFSKSVEQRPLMRKFEIDLIKGKNNHFLRRHN